MISTPSFNCAVRVAFAAMPEHRVALVRIAGIWFVKVLP